ncbi:hypothetical protein [Geminisphaera colitermitum]|uniref:hypothetical protein n=1 Tax=Geminisphaera colitermitum TaxID=1148786 RepID=UPI000158D4BB|nr:hypothetical protein [Geminisphaera colitermitum]
MATINTPLFASQTGAVAGWKSSVLSQGKVRLASVVIPSGTVLAVGDKINLVRLPANARVLPALSVSNNGNATARVSIGDAAVVDRYAAAVGNAARAYLSSFGNKPDADIGVGNEDIVATVTTGATLATDWTIYIAFSVV